MFYLYLGLYSERFGFVFGEIKEPITYYIYDK